jgi:hypothetical protein
LAQVIAKEMTNAFWWRQESARSAFSIPGDVGDTGVLFPNLCLRLPGFVLTSSA